MIVVNFGHPLSQEQQSQIATLVGSELDRVIDVPTQFVPGRPFAAQVASLAASAGLTPTEWQTLPLLINLPGFSAIAGALVAYLHGMLGHFPTIIRISPRLGSTPTIFDVVELINLQRVRDAGRGDADMIERHQSDQVLDRLLNSNRAPLLYILFSMLFGILVNSVFDVLKEQVGTLVAFLVVAVMILALFLIVWFYLIIRRWSQSALDLVVPEGAVAPKRGLITLVSPGKPEDVAALDAIKRHLSALEHIWLFHTSPPVEEPQFPFKSSYAIAHDLKQQFDTDTCRVHLVHIEDQDSPVEVFDKAIGAYRDARRFRLKSDDVVADVTGGTKAMSIGLAYAGLPAARRLEYLKPNAYLPDGRIDLTHGSVPRLIDVRVSDPEELFRS